MISFIENERDVEKEDNDVVISKLSVIVFRIQIQFYGKHNELVQCIIFTWLNAQHRRAHENYVFDKDKRKWKNTWKNGKIYSTLIRN